MKVKCMILVLAMASLHISYANSGSYTTNGAGSMLIPLNNHNIEMVREVINISVEPSDAFGTIKSQYDCRFVFRNLTDKTQKVLMGFPAENKIIWDTAPGIEEETPYDLGSNINDFKTFINDLETETEVFRSGNNLELPGIDSYGSVHSFTVNFTPNQELIVRNTFSMESSIDFVLGRGAEILYILKTGATWANPIKDIAVNVSYAFPIEIAEIVYQGKQPQSVQDNIAYYHFTETVPDFDIRIFINWKFNLEYNYFYALLDKHIDNNDISSILPAISFSYLLNVPDEPDDPENIYEPRTSAETDLLRRTLFSLGNFFYQKNDFEEAGEFFLQSFKYTKGNADRLCRPEDLLQKNLADWGADPSNMAPSYFSAYNCACCYSLRAGQEKAENKDYYVRSIHRAVQWLEIAWRLNPGKISKLAENDSDLATVKELAKDKLVFLRP
ncbi:MAG: hypothetical protein JW874_14580 [Spirochaetales bacterium]|nr:hypothetical protein [Spirochaetales bacterium]